MDEVLENKMILNAYRGVLRSIKSRRSKEETKIIRKAFNLAVNAHRNDRRKSGEPYIFHPLAVARICGDEIGLGTISIVCASGAVLIGNWLPISTRLVISTNMMMA